LVRVQRLYVGTDYGSLARHRIHQNMADSERPLVVAHCFLGVLANSRGSSSAASVGGHSMLHDWFIIHVIPIILLVLEIVANLLILSVPFVAGYLVLGRRYRLLGDRVPRPLLWTWLIAGVVLWGAIAAIYLWLRTNTPTGLVILIVAIPIVVLVGGIVLFVSVAYVATKTTVQRLQR
jgi:hypothetical protein